MTTKEYNLSVDQFSDNVFRFALKNIKDEEKAKDIVQDTYEKLWVRVDEVNFEKVRSWLFTTAYHAIVDLTRREKKQGEYNETKVRRMGHNDHYSDLKEILQEAVSKLPEIQRHVIMLRDYEGYSYEEIGKITGLSNSQVKVYLHRARLQLKQYLVKPENLI